VDLGLIFDQLDGAVRVSLFVLDACASDCSASRRGLWRGRDERSARPC
jgi:hypothetical protein